jgi:hypothetical protein
MQELFKTTTNSNKAYWENYSRKGDVIKPVMPRLPESALQMPKAPVPPTRSTLESVAAALAENPLLKRLAETQVPMTVKILFVSLILILAYRSQLAVDGFRREVQFTQQRTRSSHPFQWAQRVAVVYRGSHVSPEFGYECCWENVRENLVNPFRSIGSKVDIFVGTPFSEKLGEMSKSMELADLWMFDHFTDPITTLVMCLDNLRAYCERESVKYDLIVTLRFDMIFKVPVFSLPVQPSKFGLLWGELSDDGSLDGWRVQHMVSDTLHFFAYNHIDPLVVALKELRRKYRLFKVEDANIKRLYDTLVEVVDPSEIVFLVKGHCWSDTRRAPNPVYEIAGVRGAASDHIPASCPSKITDRRFEVMTPEQQMANELTVEQYHYLRNSTSNTTRN